MKGSVSDDPSVVLTFTEHVQRDAGPANRLEAMARRRADVLRGLVVIEEIVETIQRLQEAAETGDGHGGGGLS